MTIESATYISDLNALYPEAGSNAGQGDDHLRLIKTTLDNSFPNFAGAAVSCTEAELNALDLTTGAGTGEVSKALVADGSGDIDLTAIDFNNVDIDSGTIDGAVIGGASAAAITGTTLKADTSLELASGTTANEISIDGTLADDSDDAIPTEKAVKAYADTKTGITVGTPVATTSGTAVTLSAAIPATAKRITLVFDQVSTSGTSDWIVQLGDSGGFETTGYTSGASLIGASTVSTTSSTNGFLVNIGSAATSMDGTMSIINVASNDWVESHNMGSNVVGGYVGGGTKTLSGTLTQIRITTEGGTDTFDSGAITVVVE